MECAFEYLMNNVRLHLKLMVTIIDLSSPHSTYPASDHEQIDSEGASILYSLIDRSLVWVGVILRRVLYYIVSWF